MNDDSLKRDKFLGLKLINADMSSFCYHLFLSLQKSHDCQFIFTPNPEMYVHALKDKSFFKILERAQWLLPDGIGVVLMARLLSRIKFKSRLTGVDFFEKILNLTNNSFSEKNVFTDEKLIADFQVDSMKVYLVGGAEGAALLLKNKFKSVVGYYDKKIINVDEINFDIIKDINELKPDVVFVALGAVKQEKWILNYYKFLKSVKLMVGVGGALDFVAGKQKRAPMLLQRLGLEWLWRLFRQPSRLIRIWNAVLVFPILVFWNTILLKYFRD